MITQRTYGTRLPRESGRDGLLSAYADLYGRAERTLFARLRAGEQLVALKRTFLVRFGLTARQFNALAVDLRGKIASIEQSRPMPISNLERRIRRARTVLRKIPHCTVRYHHKRRRLIRLKQRLGGLRADTTIGRVPLCFGSRKLFRQQFALQANGYASHRDWLREWRAARSNQFFVLGSKDETAGSEGCVATVDTDGTIALRLRLPNTLAVNGKYITINGIKFAYGHDAVVAAIVRNLSPDKRDWGAISWRFVRDDKGWRVCATVAVPAGRRTSVDQIGVVAVDLNADHLAVTELDRFGNPVVSFRVPCVTTGKTHHRALATIGQAVNQVVTYACVREKPIVLERLDFDKKKAELERRGARHARRLSGFAYAAFHRVLSARSYDTGVLLHRVNPAYTSVIGQHKFADRYGLSRHRAAALSIGRRGMWLGERPNRRMGDHVAVPLPERNRGKHVWSFWRQVARRAAAQRARGRPGLLARSLPVPIPGSLGRGPVCDQFVRCRWNSGTRIVSSAVRLTSWTSDECPWNQER
jgi:IS605 OrfB family transposase